MLNSRQTLLSLLILCWLCAPVSAQEERSDVLVRDSFETGEKAPEGWSRGQAVPSVDYIYDLKQASDGSRSLSLKKSARRYFPIAAWTKKFQHESDKAAIHLSVKVKAVRTTKAIVDVIFLDGNDEWIKHEWAAYIGQEQPNDPVVTHDWKSYGKSLEIPTGTTQIVVSLQIYGPGSVWFDELEVRYVDSIDANNTSSRMSEAGPSPAENPVPLTIQTASNRQVDYLFIPVESESGDIDQEHPLLVVLPGGDGSTEFHRFVRHIHRELLDGQYLIAQPIAPPHIVWPTEYWKDRIRTTEDAIAAVVNDVAEKHQVDRNRVYALGWSSSGPAVYAAFLQEDSPLTGAFIAMSVFKPDQLPVLSNAAGRRVYLLHSPEDATCPYRMAVDAKEQLSANGGEVMLVDYAGGHGWHPEALQRIREGMDWLEKGSVER